MGTCCLDQLFSYTNAVRVVKVYESLYRDPFHLAGDGREQSELYEHSRYLTVTGDHSKARR